MLPDQALVMAQHQNNTQQQWDLLCPQLNVIKISNFKFIKYCLNVEGLFFFGVPIVGLVMMPITIADFIGIKVGVTEHFQKSLLEGLNW